MFLEEPCELPCQEPNQSMPGAGSTTSSSTATGASSSSATSTAMAAAATAAFTGSTNTPDVNGGSGGSTSGSSSSHHSPYDLRRKSPPHHYAAAGTSGTPVSSVLASTNYSASMLPARKRPRRTCSVTSECEYLFVELFLLKMRICIIQNIYLKVEGNGFFFAHGRHNFKADIY